MSDLDRLRHTYVARDTRQANTDLYSVFSPAHLFMCQQRQRATLAILKRCGYQTLTKSRILELGCGGGAVLREYLEYGASAAQLFGIDLLFERLREARDHVSLPVTCGDGQSLPYQSETFDIVLQATAFSSILDSDIKGKMANEILRVLKRSAGLIIWYDFWLNPTNPNTQGIGPAEIRTLFPNCQFEFYKITLAPPIARRLVPISWTLAFVLERLRLFNSHYLVAIRKS